jgi:hypothetical protein
MLIQFLHSEKKKNVAYKGFIQTAEGASAL